ncbi:MAG TPA: hypothetical protein VGH76_12185 [Actinomycetospora sp.]|jgi:hypothetical protein|uniref:hypothetical protein n=1 Tax=Actinomycetospora sp. TaxID=1872135 RepID=UPI002F42BB2B
MTYVSPSGPGPRALRRRPGCPRAAARDRLLADLRSALAAAWLGEDPLPLEHLGAGPVRSRDDVAARVDSLAHELCERMDAEGWDPGAAPLAVTSVLAASVPAAEALLLRAAGPEGRAREVW